MASKFNVGDQVLYSNRSGSQPPPNSPPQFVAVIFAIDSTSLPSPLYHIAYDKYGGWDIPENMKPAGLDLQGKFGWTVPGVDLSLIPSSFFSIEELFG